MSLKTFLLLSIPATISGVYETWAGVPPTHGAVVYFLGIIAGLMLSHRPRDGDD